MFGLVLGFMPGWGELWPILLIIVILFGAKKIPELMRSLGSGLKEFKKASNTDEEKDNPKIEDKKS